MYLGYNGPFAMVCVLCVVLIHLSDQVRLIELYNQNRYNPFVKHLQVIDKRYRQHIYLRKTMKDSRSEFSITSQFLVSKINFLKKLSVLRAVFIELKFR